MSSVEIETLKPMARWLKVDLTRQLRGRGMTAICAKRPSRMTAWSCLMFGGMGLLSKLNPMASIMLIFGAASVALAIFLILEFNKPHTSAIRVSPAALEQAIVQLDQPS